VKQTVNSADHAHATHQFITHKKAESSMPDLDPPPTLPILVNIQYVIVRVSPPVQHPGPA
jgi:hypothetical protein